jgi:D-lactate dehydrogenase (cytochrome)
MVAQTLIGLPIDDYPDCLRDESRRTGRAESISFPKDEAELAAQLRALHRLGVAVTVQGARTGITAGAVPEGGHVLNLGRMNLILGSGAAPDTLRVQPGVLLSDLRTHVSTLKRVAITAGNPLLGGVPEGRGGFPSTLDTRHSTLFFPPDPTETSASIGGMVANNASGAQSFFYGPTRRYVTRLRVVLIDGDILDLRRGEHRARGRHFALRTEGGRAIEGDLPSYAMPHVKNAAGYYAADNMDLIDLFIGAEGTLGVFSEIELGLIPAPRVVWGVMGFFPGEAEAVAFVRKVRDQESGIRSQGSVSGFQLSAFIPHPSIPSLEGCPKGGVGSSSPSTPDPRHSALVALEFFDPHALDLLRREKAGNPAFKDLPEMPAAWHTGAYLEYHGDDGNAVEAAVMAMSDILAECGGDPDATWLASDAAEMARLKAFRHAVPEAVNLCIDTRRKTEPALTKLGTDLAVPDDRLEDVLALYRDGLATAGLEYVVFGHIGDNHVHVNVLSRNLDDYTRGKALYIEWAKAVVAMGGTVSAEHGIGKLKVDLLRAMVGDDGLAQMRAVKRLFDPDFRLNRGNVLGVL